MRVPAYLSPSAIGIWLKNPEEYYMLYLCETRTPRFLQTQPMSIGSAFDAYTKHFLHTRLFGNDANSRFALRTIFEAQVEPHNRDWAWTHGAHAFAAYQKSGALADLLLELEASVGTPRFEIEVRGAVHHEGSAPVLLGKPDCYYINKFGCHVILDWKVSGWCSKYNVSPKAGYLRLRAGSGQHIISGPHKDCMVMEWRGTPINCATYLENIAEDWARQLSIYGWLLGVPVGEEFITAIDQMVCKPTGGTYPEIKIAEHRLRVSPAFQRATFEIAKQLWDAVNSNHIFRDLSVEESQARCLTLDKQAVGLTGPQSDSDRMFNNMARGD